MEDDKKEIVEPTTERSRTKMPGLMRNYISFVGIAIAAASLTSIGLLLLMEFSTPHQNPYTDLITFILIPSILGFGILIILLGMFLERRRRKTKPPGEILAYPIIDLNDPSKRRSLIVFMCGAFVFLFMSAYGSYRAFEYTESVTFCGQACHEVMKPEFVAYNASPHAKIRCVECHVGGGAEAYVRAKMGGMRQLYGVITDNFSRPIHTPVDNIREARETCQKCHWSEKFHGDKISVFNHYGYDAENSLNQTRLLIKVGGGDPKGGPVGGIHWHMNVTNEISFISADERRQTIPWVRMKDASGKVIEFKTKDFLMGASEIEKTEKRRMDCIDCHNRPAHRYLSPNRAVDQALEAGKLDIELPFIKAKAVEALAGQYATNDEAVRTIAETIPTYYRVNHPEFFNGKEASINGAVTEIQRIYQTFFFPEMRTDWRASPDNIGHLNAQGCFRCHDGQHFSNEGKVIRNDCNICHTTIDQTFKGQTLRPADGAFQHPVNLGDRNTWQCATCHKGAGTFKHPLNLGDISKFQCAECHKGQSGVY